MWFARAPMIAVEQQPETVAEFLTDRLYRVAGPFPAFRQATMDEGLEFVSESQRLFVAFVETYLLVVDEGGDPAAPDAWRGRALEPVDISQAPRDAVDIEPPQLLGLELELADDAPPEEPQVGVRCRIRDEQSGIGDGGYSSPSQARLRSRSGQMGDAIFTPATRISGDEHDGTYLDRIKIGQHMERGEWHVEQLMLVDKAGNRRAYLKAELEALDFPTRITIG